jgi:phosphatidylglycerophosphatase C
MNLALFDFDGTITNGDTFIPFMKEVIPSSRIFRGRLLLLPTILGYRAGVFSASCVRKQVVRIGLKGFTKVDIDAKGKRYASQYLPILLRPNALERLRWHQDVGDRVIMISN